MAIHESKMELENQLDEAKAAPMASASVVEIGYADGNLIEITGTETITSFGAAVQAGVRRTVIFTDALLLTHSDAIQLPGAVNVTTAPGDIATFVAREANEWKCVSYQRYANNPDTVAQLTEDAPVSGAQATVTVDMTNAAADLTYTAYAYGESGNSITVTHVDPEAADQELSVTVDGTDITVSLATDGLEAITSTAAEVKAAVNLAAPLLVVCEDEGAGTGVVNAATVESLAGGVDVTAGNILSMRVKADGTLGYIKTGEQTWKQFTLDALA